MDADAPGPAPAGFPLDNGSLAAICDFLDARSLAALQLVNTQARRVASNDAAWRRAFHMEFPYHHDQLVQQGCSSAFPWREEYVRREGREQRWSSGVPASEGEVLRGHRGSVLGAAFIEDAPTLPPGLLISVATMEQPSARVGEVCVWDMNPLHDTVSRQARCVQPSATSPAVPSGIFSVQHRPGTDQAVCTTFAATSAVIRLKQTGLGDAEEGMDCSMEPSHAGGADAPMQDAPGLPGDYAYETLFALIGHQSACPSSRCQGNVVVTASFDGTLKLFKPPEDDPPSSEQAAAGDQPSLRGGQEEVAVRQQQQQQQQGMRRPVEVSAAATFSDDGLQLGDPLNQNRGASCLAVEPGCARLASGGNDMQVKLWDVETARVLLRLTGHEGWVWNAELVAESADTVVSGATDGTVRVWDTRAGRQAAALDVSRRQAGSIYPMAGLALRPDGRYLAAGCFDSAVYVADFRKLQVLNALHGHSDRVSRVLLRGDELLSCSFDSTMQLWEF